MASTIKTMSTGGGGGMSTRRGVSAKIRDKAIKETKE